jgi:hypothetical protein
VKYPGPARSRVSMQEYAKLKHVSHGIVQVWRFKRLLVLATDKRVDVLLSNARLARVAKFRRLEMRAQRPADEKAGIAAQSTV